MEGQKKASTGYPRKKNNKQDALSVIEATQLLNELAFERLDSTMICFCLTQLIRHIRLQTMASREEIVQRLMGESGLTKVYNIFNSNQVSGVRKLAGRLICESMQDSPKNQDFLCEILELDCIYGRVTINRNLPLIIKQKLSDEPEFLFSLHSMEKFTRKAASGGSGLDEARGGPGTASAADDYEDLGGEAEDEEMKQKKCYWSFPQFKEISSAVLSQQQKQQQSANQFAYISGSHFKSESVDGGQDDSETQTHYINFPDPQLYLIGFDLSREIRQLSQPNQQSSAAGHTQGLILVGGDSDIAAPERSMIEKDSYFVEQKQQQEPQFEILGSQHIRPVTQGVDPNHSSSPQRAESTEDQGLRQQKYVAQGRGTTPDISKYEKESPSLNHSYIVTLDGISIQQNAHQQKQTRVPYISSGGGTRNQGQAVQSARGMTRDSQQSKQSKQSSSSTNSYTRFRMGLGQQSSQSGANSFRMQMATRHTHMTRGNSGTTGGYPVEYNLKRTSESTESESSQAHYMRETSSSLQRAGKRNFGRSPQDVQFTQGSTQITTAQQNFAILRNYKMSSASNGSQEPLVSAHQTQPLNFAGIPQGGTDIFSSRLTNPKNANNEMSRTITNPADKNKTMKIKSLQIQKVAQNYLNNSQVNPGPLQMRQGVSHTSSKKQSSNFSSMAKNQNSWNQQVDDTLVSTTPFEMQDSGNLSPRRAKTARGNGSNSPQALAAAHYRDPQQVRTDQVLKISQQLNSGDLSASPTELKGIIKKLNKPEMLLLNHLQNQIKFYYPSKMNKYLNLDQSNQISEKAIMSSLNASIDTVKMNTQTPDPSGRSEQQKSLSKWKKNQNSTSPHSPFVQTSTMGQMDQPMPVSARTTTGTSNRQGSGLFQTIEKQRIQLNQSQLAMQQQQQQSGINQTQNPSQAAHQWSTNQSRKHQIQQAQQNNTGMAVSSNKKRSYLTKGAGSHQKNVSNTLTHKSNKKQVTTSLKRSLVEQNPNHSQNPSNYMQNQTVINVTGSETNGGFRSQRQQYQDQIAFSAVPGSHESYIAVKPSQISPISQTSKNHSKFISASQQQQSVTGQDNSFRGHTKRGQLETSYSGRQSSNVSNNASQKQQNTTSTSITRRQQELSNARLFAGARASVTLKSSLQNQQARTTGLKQGNSSGGASTQHQQTKRQKQASNVLNQTSQYAQRGDTQSTFQTRQPSRSHGTKTGVSSAAMRGDFQPIAETSYHNQHYQQNANSQFRQQSNQKTRNNIQYVGGGSGAVTERTKATRLVHDDFLTNEGKLPTASSRASVTEQTQQATAAAPQSAYLKVLESMKTGKTSQQQQTRASRSPNLKTHKNANYLLGGSVGQHNLHRQVHHQQDVGSSIDGHLVSQNNNNFIRKLNAKKVAGTTTNTGLHSSMVTPPKKVAESQQNHIFT